MKSHLRVVLIILSLSCSLIPGIVFAGYDEGLAAFKDEDYATALREWEPLAMKGDARAQKELGVMYFIGLGVAQDSREAVKWYRLAADQGHPDAQNSLGYVYAIGMGVTQDYKEAVRWYRLAADQGHASAQNNLGVMFEHGRGVPPNRVIAYALYNRSAANNPSKYNDAVADRAKLVESMSAKEIEAAQNLTRNMEKPGNLVKALDAYAKNPAVKEKPKPVAQNDRNDAPPPSDGFPARPAKRPGVVTCNTNCLNGDCRRTYDDGRKVRFQAQRKFNPLTSNWEFDSSGC